jgi:Mor family transcriptional regulator
VRDLARKYRFTERWIYEILGRPSHEGLQGELF